MTTLPTTPDALPWLRPSDAPRMTTPELVEWATKAAERVEVTCPVCEMAFPAGPTGSMPTIAEHIENPGPLCDRDLWGERLSDEEVFDNNAGEWRTELVRIGDTTTVRPIIEKLARLTPDERAYVEQLVEGVICHRGKP